MEECIYIARLVTSGEYNGYEYAFVKCVFVNEKGMPYIEKVKPELTKKLEAGKSYTLVYNKYRKLVDII